MSPGSVQDTQGHPWEQAKHRSTHSLTRPSLIPRWELWGLKKAVEDLEAKKAPPPHPQAPVKLGVRESRSC